RQLPSGRYQAHWEGPDGHRHNGPDTFATRTAADRWLAGELVELTAGTWIDERDSSVAFGVYADHWRRTLVDLRPSTKGRDLGYLDRYILPRWAGIPLHDIDHDDIKAWVKELLDDDNLAPATITKAGQILSKILDAAVRSRKLAHNPAKGVKLPRTPQGEMT